MINRQALNIVANFSGVGARLIFSLVFNIIYFRLLGSESYGLIGFYVSLAALSALFDLGLNQTVVREVARRGTDGEGAGELRTVVFTLQLLLVGIGLSLGLLVAIAAPWIAASWFSAARLATPEITASVALMGGALALLFPANVFYGTLTGLQRQVLSNGIIVAATAFRGALTIVALFVFGPSPVIFFSAQIVVSAIEAGVLCLVIWRLLPPSAQRLRFDAALLRATWKFSSQTWLAVTFAQIAMLGDKIILSTLLPLHLFGLYSLAVTVTSIIQRLAAPFTNTFFPYFVRLKEQDGADALPGAYSAGLRIRVRDLSRRRALADRLCCSRRANAVHRCGRYCKAGMADRAAGGGQHAERGDGAAVYAAVRPRHHGRRPADQSCTVRAVSGGAGSAGAALRRGGGRGAVACRQCADASGADCDDASPGAAWTGVAVAASYRPVAGMRRGGSACGRECCDARPFAPADVDLDWSQRRAGAGRRAILCPRDRGTSFSRASATGAAPSSTLSPDRRQSAR